MVAAASERLKNRDYTIIVDKSGSMGAADCAMGKTRWTSVQESTLAVARKLEEYDPDGLTLYLFSSGFRRHDNVQAAHVEDVFREHEPMGGTYLAPVLADVFAQWAQRKRNGQLKQGETVLVVTDGAPLDPAEVEREIIAVTKRMDADEELAISFLQVGKDPQAASYLKHLDDGLQAKGAKFDIVDTKTFEELERLPLTDVLIAALDD